MGRSLRRCSRGMQHSNHMRWQLCKVMAPEDLSVGQKVEVEDRDIDDPDPVSLG